MTIAVPRTPVTLLTGSPGPDQQVAVTIPVTDGSTSAPLVIEDSAPGCSGAWRRVTADGAVPTHGRIARIAAP